MLLKKMFDTMIEAGWKSDWRDRSTLEKQLAQRKAEYDALTGYEKRYYDRERLVNPFGCSRIAAGSPDLEIQGMMVGINCTLAGILYAERLRDKGRRIDAFLAHHGISPAGSLYADINNTHYDILREYGVPEPTARQVVDQAIRGYELRMSNEPTGLEQHTDLALFNVHNPMDNLAALYLIKLFARNKPRTLNDIIELMLTIEEFAIAARYNVTPEIAHGSPGDRAGHIYCDGLGGISLNDGELKALLSTGKVDTVIRLNYNNCLQVCREAGVNLIFKLHNAFDNLALNLMLDQVLATGNIDIVPVDGFYRIERAPMTDFNWPANRTGGTAKGDD